MSGWEACKFGHVTTAHAQYRLPSEEVIVAGGDGEYGYSNTVDYLSNF